MDYGQSLTNRVLGGIVGTISVGVSLFIMWLILWGQ